jgi:c(7)-type cytochrome triheme protein
MQRTALFLAFLLLPVQAVAGERQDIVFHTKNGDVVFSHEYHTAVRGIKCAACHFAAFASSESGYIMKKEKLTKRDFCEHCHNGMKGFDARAERNCVRCHKKQ